MPSGKGERNIVPIVSECRDKGEKMREIEATGSVVLACRSCEERTVLLGSTDDWQREGRVTFSCGGCGRELTLADRVVEASPDAAGMTPGPG